MMIFFGLTRIQAMSFKRLFSRFFVRFSLLLEALFCPL